MDEAKSLVLWPDEVRRTKEGWDWPFWAGPVCLVENFDVVVTNFSPKSEQHCTCYLLKKHFYNNLTLNAIQLKREAF